MTGRGPLAVVPALRADDIVDLFLHQLADDAEPDADREREQPLPGGADQLAERLLDTGRQHILLSGRGLRERYGLLHGGSSLDLWWIARTLPVGADGAGGTAVKFYELRDNLRTKATRTHRRR